MTNRITVTYEENGVETTYSKELPEDTMLDDMFIAYLEANQRFTFQNDVTVNIHNPIFEDSIIGWTKDNGVSTDNSYEIEQEPVNVGTLLHEPENYKERSDAWEVIWDTLCLNMPQDIWQDISQDGSGIDNAVDAINFLINYYERNERLEYLKDMTEAMSTALDHISGVQQDKWCSGSITSKPSEEWYMGYRY